MPTPDDDEVTEFLEVDEPAPEPDRASGGEPAWRARLRSSSFGQAAVVLVTAFAIAIAAWWVVKPGDQDPTRAESEAMSQVEVAGVQQPPSVGDSAPGFTATDIDGTPVSLEELRGKPVWLVFMATWCARAAARRSRTSRASWRPGEMRSGSSWSTSARARTR